MTKQLIGTYNNYEIVKITQDIIGKELVTKYVDGQPYKEWITIHEQVEYYSIERDGSWIRQFETRVELNAYLA